MEYLSKNHELFMEDSKECA